MAFNTQAVSDRLIAVLNGLSGIGWVQYGAPLSKGPRVGAYVTMGSQRPNPKYTGAMVREARYFINFAYRLDGAEATAETALMGLVDAFLEALDADMTLAQTCQGIKIDTGLADEPDYRERAGKEYREYPIVITATQYSTFNTQP